MQRKYEIEKKFAIDARKKLEEIVKKQYERKISENEIQEKASMWFIRIIATRYMEINKMLPLSEKQIKEETNKIEKSKFKYMLVQACKKLEKVLPQIFGEKLDESILDKIEENGIIDKLIKEIPEESFKKVEIIGWLYQYYISENKEKIFKELKNEKIKISKNDIPVATQLFTPDWIVKYMVENTLGRYFENPEKFEYYIQNDILDEKIDDIENITFLDPCCGSGHILVYAFEIFFKLYREHGYSKEKAVEKILTKNLYGIDLDNNATNLTRLALCLKAREYDEEFFGKDIAQKLNIVSINETNSLDEKDFEKNEDLKYIFETFKNAKEYGSLLRCEKRNYKTLLKENLQNELIKQAIMLSKKYDIVCTNPPYMGKKSLNETLSKYLAKEYSDTKTELYSAFIERCNEFTKNKGYLAMITIHSWMFISSFKNLRKYILNNGTIINMLHTGPATFTDLSAFNVLATAFCIKKEKLDIKSTFVRLADYYNPEEKIANFNNKSNYYYLNQNILKEIPEAPFVYWISDSIRNVFKNNRTLGNYYKPKQGLATGDNNKYLRMWYEVNWNDIEFNCGSHEECYKSNKKWFPYNKGGNYRKWYGNNEWVVNWQKDGEEIKNFKDSKGKLKSRPQNLEYYFKEGITWSLFGFENFGVRYKEKGFIFDVSGSSMFPDKDNLYYVMGYLCSNVAFKFLSILAPTVNFQVGNIANLPYKEIDDKQLINKLVKENIEICKDEWNSHETSWDFEEHSLLKYKVNNSIKDSFYNYEKIYNKLRNRLRENEEKLNEIYKQIYEVDDVEITVNDRDLTLKKLDKKDVIKSFISYSVGCMFGRYSLDEKGLVYAGGVFDANKYKSFMASCNNIIITDKSDFCNDIVEQFYLFLKTAYGDENFGENVDFIAEILRKRKGLTSEDIIRRYFYDEFYKDHLKMYQNRPIYELFFSRENNVKYLSYNLVDDCNFMDISNEKQPRG